MNEPVLDPNQFQDNVFSEESTKFAATQPQRGTLKGNGNLGGEIGIAHSTVAEIKQLEQRLAERRALHIAAALSCRDEAIEELDALGYTETLVHMHPSVAAEETSSVVVTTAPAAEPPKRRGRKPKLATATDAIDARSVARDAKLAAAKNGKAKRGSKPAAEGTCQYCGVPGHDGRKHRGQKTKKAFTAAELAAL